MKTDRRRCALSALVLAALLGGCAGSGPKVVATESKISYKVSKPLFLSREERRNPPALPEYLVVRTAERDERRIARWRWASGDTLEVSLQGVDGLACYMAVDARGRAVRVRDDPNDPHTFRLPRHAELANAHLELAELKLRQQRLLAQAGESERQLADAQRWLAGSAHFQRGVCTRPPQGAIPEQPASACAPGTSTRHAQSACWGSFVVGYGCDKARALMGMNSGLSGFAGSLACGELAARAQGESLTVESWLLDQLINVPLQQCFEGMLRGEDMVSNTICTALFLPFFAARMNHCMRQAATSCSRSWEAWNRNAVETRAYPDRIVQTCQMNVRTVESGTEPSVRTRREAAELDGSIRNSTARVEARRRAIGETNLSAQPCSRVN